MTFSIKLFRTVMELVLSSEYNYLLLSYKRYVYAVSFVCVCYFFFMKSKATDSRNDSNDMIVIR